MAKYLGENGLRELISLLKGYVDTEISSLDLDLFIVVATLPETGEANKIYLVPAGTTEQQNVYAEYIWVDDAWEKLGEAQIEVDLSDYYKKEETYSQSEVNAMIGELESHEIDSYTISGTAPLTLTGSYNASTKTLTITGSVDAYSKSEIDETVTKLEEEITTATAGGLTSVTASGTSPLTLSASQSGTAVTITGSVDLSDYATTADVSSSVSTLESEISTKQDTLTAGSNVTISNNTISATVPTKTSDLTNDSGFITSADIPDAPTLSDLGGVGTINASGTSPLTLSASKSDTTVTISGSIAAASASANGYMTSEQYTELTNLVDDPLQYASEITASDVDSMWNDAN